MARLAVAVSFLHLCFRCADPAFSVVKMPVLSGCYALVYPTFLLPGLFSLPLMELLRGNVYIPTESEELKHVTKKKPPKFINT